MAALRVIETQLLLVIRPFETTIGRASSTGSEGMVWHSRLIPLSVVGVLDGERNDLTWGSEQGLASTEIHLISNNVVASLTLGGDTISSVNRVILDLEAQMVVQDICVGALRLSIDEQTLYFFHAFTVFLEPSSGASLPPTG